MNVIIQSDILEELKGSLKSLNKNAVRFEVVNFGWSGPVFDIVLDEQRENDVVKEVNGIKFVADNEIAFLIKNPEIIKNSSGFTVKKSGCCG